MMDQKNSQDGASSSNSADDSTWSSDPSTVERRDAERPESGADTDDMEILNRSGAGMRTPRRYEETDRPEKG